MNLALRKADKLVSERQDSSASILHKLSVDGIREHIKLMTQETLDELFIEKLIPFRLTAYKANADGPGAYTVPFCDSRIHSISFFWKDGESFSAAVRKAVLDRVKRMGPQRLIA